MESNHSLKGIEIITKVKVLYSLIMVGSKLHNDLLRWVDPNKVTSVEIRYTIVMGRLTIDHIKENAWN